MAVFLGIDTGTSSVKSLLLGEDGTVFGTAWKEYEVKRPDPLMAEQRMEQIWKCTVLTIRSLLEKYPEIRDQIAGIGFSGQMHGLVMVDKEGREVRDTIIWADQRSGESIRRIYEMVPEEEYESRILNSLSPGFLVSSLVWIRDHEPENYAKIHKVMLPKDFVRFRMTGEMGTDASDASGTGIFDTAKRQWAWDLIRRTGLEESFFVPCHESAERAGPLSSSCAEETGLPEGIPVFYGGGDTPVQALGNGMLYPGTAISNIGTAAQFLTVSDQPLYDPQFRTNTFCYVQQNQWLVMGASLTGGAALKWLKNNVLDMESYEAMNDLAETSPPGSRGLFFLPCLNGERTPWKDPHARGMYFGLNLNHNRSDLIRSLMEGILYSQRCSLEIFREMGLSFDQVIASGGGSRGRVMKRIMADIFGCPVRTSLVREQGCVGAAMIAAVGTGTFSDFREACSVLVRFSDEVVEPDPENRKVYEEGFLLFEELYPANQKLFKFYDTAHR